MTKTYVRYRANGVTTVMEFKRDPFEVCNAVRAQMFPDVELPAVDKKFDAMMAERQRISTAARSRKE